MNWFKALLTVAALGVLVIVPTAAQKTDSAQAMLAAAKQKVTLEGDLAGAIKQYQAIVDRYIKSDRGVAAEALLQMADCYQKQGSMQATKIYERVVREFSDQAAALVEARKHLVPAGAVSALDALPRRVLKGGTAMVADVSRDGRLAVGRESPVGGGINLVLHDLLSGRVTMLVPRSASGSGNGPVMSNDGRRVAYFWTESVAGGPQQRSIRIIGIEPGSVPEVVLAPQPESVVQGGSGPLAWSPDGKEILARIVRNNDPASREVAWISVENKSVRTIRTLGPLSGQWLNYALSPDGRFIAFTSRPRSDSTDQYLYVMDANGQHETAIVKGAGERWDPVWTPDGSHLLFAGDSTGGSALWSIGIRDGRAAGEPSIVQTGFTESYPIGMSASGTFYYARLVDGVDYALVAQRNPSPGDRAQAFPGLRTSWSRDGRLAFVRAAGQGSVNDLIIRDARTGEERSYRRPGLINSVSPRWLHDGSGVIVVIDEQGTGARVSAAQAFYRVDARTGTFQRLFAKDANNRIRSAESAISLDDKTLYLTVRQSPGTATTGLVGVDLTTGTEKPVFTFGGAGLRGGASPSLEVSPDGTTLAVMALADGPGGARQARIFSVRVDGSNYREIYGLFPIFAGPRDKMRWTPDGRAIVFVVPDPADRNSARLMRVSAEGGEATFDGLDVDTMSRLVPGLHLDRLYSMGDFALSPDGSQAVLSARTQATYELWSIDNLLSVVKSR